MAWVPMVTRTMKTTKVNVLCMDLINAEPVNRDLTIPRVYKDEKKLFKVVQSILDNDEIKAVKIVKSEEVEILYGMTEQEFMENAQILDPETRKIIEQ